MLNLSTSMEIEKPTNVLKSSRVLEFDISFKQLASIMHIVNAILVFISMLYTLIMFLCMSASFGGNLGGLSQISRAFYSSLVMLILIFPWQVIFNSTVFGAIYTPGELIKWGLTDKNSIFSAVLIYLRFIGCWAFVIILLMKAQIHSFRWTRAVLHKLAYSSKSSI